jgi:hypothetical protein
LEIVALYPHRRQLSTKVRLFLDMLVDRFVEEQRGFDATPDRQDRSGRFRRSAAGALVAAQRVLLCCGHCLEISRRGDERTFSG